MESEPPVVVALEESSGAGLLLDVPAALLGVAGAVDGDEDAAELDASEAGALGEVEFMAESLWARRLQPVKTTARAAAAR